MKIRILVQVGYFSSGDPGYAATGCSGLDLHTLREEFDLWNEPIDRIVEEYWVEVEVPDTLKPVAMTTLTTATTETITTSEDAD